MMNEDQIRRVENAGAPGAHAISDRWRKNGMFDWECFECDPANFCRRLLFYRMAIFDWVALYFLPRFLRSVHRTRCALFQSPRVIGVRVRENDRVRIHAFEFP